MRGCAVASRGSAAAAPTEGRRPAARRCVAASPAAGAASASVMKHARPPPAVASFAALLALAAGCGGEESHEHEVSDFGSLAECEAHYEAEGRDADEIAELCAGLT